MPKKRNKEDEGRQEENILQQNASGNVGQSTSGKNNVAHHQKEQEVDLEKVNRINQSRRGVYSRNGHGGYRGL
jgi:hypothetical protein